MMKYSLFWLMSVAILLGAATTDPYRIEIQKWQQQRLKDLKNENGWLTLVGLFWLEEGDNPVGSSSRIHLPDKAPALVGKIVVQNRKVTFVPEAGTNVYVKGKRVVAPIKLLSDGNGKTEPTVVEIGSIQFFVIERAGKLGVRVRDKDSPARERLSSLDYFPIDPKWRVEATFKRYDPPKKIKILNILNFLEEKTCPGALVFSISGNTYRLDVLAEPGDKEFFVIFADQTNGKETYGAGRYLYTALPDTKGKVWLDFNKAYSPPCAFTEFATCPLPPPQNRLKIAIPAGEKYTAKH